MKKIGTILSLVFMSLTAFGSGSSGLQNCVLESYNQLGFGPPAIKIYVGANLFAKTNNVRALYNDLTSLDGRVCNVDWDYSKRFFEILGVNEKVMNRILAEKKANKQIQADGFVTGTE